MLWFQFLLYLSVRRATGLLVFLFYFVLPSLNKVFILSYLAVKILFLSFTWEDIGVTMVTEKITIAMVI